MDARKVDAGNGWLWIKQGYALFKKSPVMWVVLTALCTMGMIGLASIPVLGDPLATLLFPVFLGGLMLGCQAQERGEELELAHLFAGFRQHTQQLVTLGGLNLVGQLLILGVMSLLGGSALVNILMAGQPVEDPEILIQAVSEGGPALMVGMLGFCVLLLAMQFAPMLAVFGRSPQAFLAMKSSLRACLRNVGALSIYGIIVILFGLVASMPMMLGWLILLPVLVTSMYVAYGDLFPVRAEAVRTVEGEAEPPANS